MAQGDCNDQSVREAAAAAAARAAKPAGNRSLQTTFQDVVSCAIAGECSATGTGGLRGTG